MSGLLDLNENSTIEYTINPDFSQVEADAAQVLVNETFAISLPERRTFFLEGTDLLNTDLDSIYTRSINSPLNALKFINQGDSTSSLIMHAIDEDSPYLAGGLYESYSGNAGKCEVTIVRSIKNLGNESNIGVLLTNRDYELEGMENWLRLMETLELKIYIL